MKKYILLFVFILTSIQLNADWKQQLYVKYDYMDNIHFIDKDNGYAATAGADFYFTSNAGKNWTKTASNITPTIKNILPIDKNISWLIVSSSDSSFCRKTTDGFKTAVTKLAIKEETFGPSFNKIYYYNNQYWVLCSYGLTYCSSDGENWISKQWNNNYNFKLLKFFDDNNGYLVGTYQGIEIFQTTDGGISWTEKKFSISETVNSIFFVDKLYGWASGYKGGIYRTTDGGESWQQQNIYDKSLNAITFINRYEGWVVGADGAIFATTDGGTNWFDDESPTTGDLHCVYSSNIDVNKFNIYAGGANTTVLCKSYTAVTSVESNINSQKNELFVSPNPCSEFIIINTLFSDFSNSKISIYNSFGLEIYRFNENELFDKNTLKISTKELNNGIYFCVVKTGETTISEKFAVVK